MLLVAAGGAVGAVCRYGVSLLALKHFKGHLALGTIIVNLTGCFLIGLAFALWQSKPTLHDAENLRMFIWIGFLGAFTTFSTYMLESADHFNKGYYCLAILNIGVSTIVGLALVLAGMWIGKTV